MANIPFPAVAFGRDGAAYTANIWTHDGQHFMVSERDPLLALHVVTLRARAAMVGLTRDPGICVECRAVEHTDHETWCTHGPRGVYP